MTYRGKNREKNIGEKFEVIYNKLSKIEK